LNTLPLPVILAGGLGTRLGNLAGGLPKPLIQVAGRPFLEYVLAALAAQGFREALLLVGHRAEVIEDCLGNGHQLGLELSYSRETVPMGTGGAFRLARGLITRRFLMLYGDLYRVIDYAAIARSTTGNSLGVYPFTHGLTTIACANVGLDSTGRRISIYAKDRPDLPLTHVDAGFGLFEPRVLEMIPAGPTSFETNVYPALAARSDLGAIVVDRSFCDIGNPSDLDRTRHWFLRILGS
jgi:NDP-sugar pyrophosphorylase family protein